MSSDFLNVFDADLNSEKSRAIMRVLFSKIGQAAARVFPTRAAICYGALLSGLALGFIPLADRRVPIKFTLVATLFGAGLVAGAAHELDELQDDIDEAREKRQQDRSLRIFAETEAKNKQAETQLLLNAHQLEKALPKELQETLSPSPSISDKVSQGEERPEVRDEFNVAVETVRAKKESPKPQDVAPSPPPPPVVLSRPKRTFTETMHQIAQRMVCMTVIGVPGAGKDMFVSNLLQLVRKSHPEIYIFVMEGKGDPKEAGYWQDVADDYRCIQALEEERESVVAWINGCLEDFRAVEGPKLLVFGEVTYLYKVWQDTERESFEKYIQYKVGLSSMGDSSQQYVWEIGQVSHTKDLGVTGGIRSLFKPVAIVSNHDRGAANALLQTKFVPLPEEGGKARVMSMCDRSPCSRAIYDFVNDCWQSLPALSNLSGFDRDTRAFIKPDSRVKADEARGADSPLPLDGVRGELERLLQVEQLEPSREPTRFGLTASQITEVQRRISGLHVGALSSVKRIRENSRSLKADGLSQVDLVELFDYLVQTGAIAWTTSDKRQFKYLGGL